MFIYICIGSFLFIDIFIVYCLNFVIFLLFKIFCKRDEVVIVKDFIGIMKFFVFIIVSVIGDKVRLRVFDFKNYLDLMMLLFYYIIKVYFFL